MEGNCSTFFLQIYVPIFPLKLDYNSWKFKDMQANGQHEDHYKLVSSLTSWLVKQTGYNVKK